MKQNIPRTNPPRVCGICEEKHRTLMQARMCCDIPPENETLAQKMKRLIGHELADIGVISREEALDAQILGSVSMLTNLGQGK